MKSLLFFFGLGIALQPVNAANPLTPNDNLKVAICQFDPIAGDIEYNLNEILKCYDRAVKAKADLMVTPELAVEGYSFGDYFEMPELWARVEKAVESLKVATQNQPTALLVGHVAANPETWGKHLQNVASAFVDGRLVYRHAKVLLPDYDIFNDARWFHPGNKAKVWKFRGHKIAVGICEDWWFDDMFGGPHNQRNYYKTDIKELYARKRVDLAISLSASPYGQDKQAYRELIHSAVAKKLNAPFIWSGMAGATDAILYDGRSFILNAKGETVDRLGLFKNDFAIVDVPADRNAPIAVTKDSASENTNPAEVEVVYRALVTGIREYARRTNAKGFVLGISGGIDSAVVAALIAEAIGPENLITVSLPSAYSSEHSKSDALALVRNLGVPEKNVDLLSIAPPYDEIRKVLGEKYWQNEGTVDENSQARLRALYLNGIANRFAGYMVAGTSNKTEIAMGYFTFGGDDKTALGILGGLWKSEVYALARYMNARAGRELIPWNTINKKASAELKPSQVSYDAKTGLPPFEVLDPLLRDYFENRIPLQELVDYYTGFLPERPHSWVADTIQLAERMDFKRRQSAPLLRVDRRKTFDWVGRRVPIAKAHLHSPLVFCNDLLSKKEIAPTPWFVTTLKPTLAESNLSKK